MPATTFITDGSGRTAVLPIKQYQQWLEGMEELEDIRAYDKAKKENPILLRDAIQQRRKRQKA